MLRSRNRSFAVRIMYIPATHAEQQNKTGAKAQGVQCKMGEPEVPDRVGWKPVS